MIARLRAWWALHRWRLEPTWDPRCAPCLEGPGQAHACIGGGCGCEERKCHKPVLIEYLSKPPVPQLATYIGSCCREYVLAVGFSPGRCRHCGEQPKWLRDDQDFDLDFPLEPWHLRSDFGEGWIQLDRRHLARTPWNAYADHLDVLHWCTRYSGWLSWRHYPVRVAPYADVLHVDRHLIHGCCGDQGFIKHGAWEATVRETITV